MNARVEAGYPVEKVVALVQAILALGCCGVVDIEGDKSTGFIFCFEHLGGASVLEGFWSVTNQGLFCMYV